MESISLKKVTAIVLICVAGAYAVSAKADEIKIENETTKKAVELASEKVSQFALLKNQFDADKNGLLSVEELKLSNAKKILSHFSKIDSNADLSISEEELTQYISQIKQ